MSLSALLFWLAPGPLARLLSDQPEILRAAAPLLFVAAVFQIADGLQGVGAGVLRGAGDTRFSLAANLVGHWGVGLPLALWLGYGRGLGVVGLWWGLCAGLSSVAVALVGRFLFLSARVVRPIRPASA
jgi:MATE family multidrug resistance protein